MPGDPSKNLQFDVSVLDQLACPACLGEVSLDADRLICKGCGRGYAIVNGIPVFIVERAIPAAGEDTLKG
jgi:uncharacterized protein YbaR (Trm112 family)